MTHGSHGFLKLSLGAVHQVVREYQLSMVSSSPPPALSRRLPAAFPSSTPWAIPALLGALQIEVTLSQPTRTDGHLKLRPEVSPAGPVRHASNQRASINTDFHQL